jgi:sulfur carrier protein
LKIFVNGESRDVGPDSRLLDVLEVTPDQELPKGVAVALDGTVVPRTRVGQTRLHEGARVEVVTAVQGG